MVDSLLNCVWLGWIRVELTTGCHCAMREYSQHGTDHGANMIERELK